MSPGWPEDRRCHVCGRPRRMGRSYCSTCRALLGRAFAGLPELPSNVRVVPR